MMSCPGSPRTNAPHRARRADAHRGIAALDLDRRGVGQIGPVAFAGVDDENAGRRAAASTTRTVPPRLQPRDVVAERRAEAAGLQKIPLHIDNDQRHPADIDGERARAPRRWS